MAGSRRDILLKILSDPDDAVEGVRTVKRELKDFDGTEAEARLTLRKQGIEAEIDKVRARLEKFSKQEYSPEVAVKMARALAQIDRLELKLDKLDHTQVTVDVDVKRGSLERVGSLLSGIGDRAGGFGGGFFSRSIGNAIQFVVGGLGAVFSALGKLPELLTTISQTVVGTFNDLRTGATTVGQVLGSVVSTLLSGVAGALAFGAAIGLLAVALSAVATALVSILGALGALAASLVFAAAGAGALAVALAALAGPAVIAMLAFMQRFAAVLAARKAHEQELTQAVQQQKTAEQQRTAAAAAARQAQEQLTTATVEGNRAMAQSARDLVASQDGLRSSKLSVDEARLAWARARKELRDFLAQAGVQGPSLNVLAKKFTDVGFAPSEAGRVLGSATGGATKVDPLDLQDKILAAKRAQETYIESVHHVAQAEADATTAQKTRAGFLNRGLRAYAPYRQALAQVAKAEQNVEKAQNAVSASQTKYQTALKKLTGTEQGFLASLDVFLKKFGDFAKVVAAPIFGGLEKAMTSLTQLASDPAIHSGFVAIGTAIGDFIANFSKTLSTSAWRSAIAGFARDAARFIGEAGKGFTNLSAVLREIARTAMPELIRMARDVSAWLGHIASQPGKIHSAVKFVVDQFKTWLSIGGHLADIVLGFLKAARGSSSTLSGYIDHLVAKWDHWINSKRGQRDVREFLRESVAHVKSMIDKLPELLKGFENFAKIVNAIADAAKFIKNVFEFIVKVVKMGPVGKLVEAVAGGAGKSTGSGHKLLSVHTGEEIIKKLLPHSVGEIAKRFLPGLATGGYTGDGDPAAIAGVVHGREFVLREAITNALGVDRLRMLNSGIPPELVFAGGASTTSTSIGQQHIGNRTVINNIDARGHDPNELERMIARAGG